MHACHCKDDENKQNIWSVEVPEQQSTQYIAVADVISHFTETLQYAMGKVIENKT